MDLDQKLNLANLSDLVGTHRNTVRNWIKEGLPATQEEDGRGEFVLVLREAVQWVLAHEQAKHERAMERLRDGGPESSKAKKLASEARLKEMQVLEREGKLVPADQVEDTWAEAMVNLRDSVMTSPAKLVQLGLVRLEDELKVEQILADSLTNAVAPEDDGEDE